MEKSWLDLAIKYGGYMETDKVFLENRLKKMTDAQKAELLVPPPSVINAYFSELYQKRAPKEATNYFFGLSKTFDMFYPQPGFGLEGSKSYELFRFIRLNIDGRAFGYSYVNEDEEALIFSELPQALDEKFLFNVAQIFPHYLIEEEKEDGCVRMKSGQSLINVDFEASHEVSPLTEVAQTDQWLKFSGYNLEDVIACAAECFTVQTLLQFNANKFIIYQRKG